MSATALEFLRAVTQDKINFNICDISKTKGFILDKYQLTEKDLSSSSPSRMAFSAMALHALGNKRLPISIKIFKNDDYDADIVGLKYEIKIYRKIIDDIITKNRSPNFVAYVMSGCCRKARPEYNPLDKGGLYAAIGPDAGIYGEYCVLVTEKVGNAAYFGIDTEQPVTTLLEIYHELPEEDQVAVMFQVCYALELVQRYRIVHNDLHGANVLVMTLPAPVTMGFNIDGVKFKVTTKYIPYLFDWDHAYCEVFGNNHKLEYDFYYKLNIYNKFNKKTDFFILSCTTGLDIPEFMSKVQDEKIKIKISKETLRKISKYKPLFIDDKGKAVFRFGRKQLQEFFGPGYDTLMYGSFFVDKEGGEFYAVFYSGFRCRPSSMDLNMETPLDYINRVCMGLKTDDFKGIENKFIYTLPSEEKVRTIFVDPLLAIRGRETLRDLGIKPRFPPQKTSFLKVKIREPVEDDEKDDY